MQADPRHNSSQKPHIFMMPCILLRISLQTPSEVYFQRSHQHEAPWQTSDYCFLCTHWLSFAHLLWWLFLFTDRLQSFSNDCILKFIISTLFSAVTVWFPELGLKSTHRSIYLQHLLYCYGQLINRLFNGMKTLEPSTRRTTRDRFSCLSYKQ